jgi:hypothetical protein
MLDENIGIPSGVIFLPGPKLDIEGFGWAPKTWMASVQHEYPYPLFLESKATFLTSKGLLVQHEGIRLRMRAVPQDRKFWVTPDRSFTQWYLVENAAEDCRYPTKKPQWLVQDCESGVIGDNPQPFISTKSSGNCTPCIDC